MISGMNGATTQPAATRAEVDKIIASRAFHGLERLSHFLRFVVEEAVDGRADQIKEYVIGVEVYRKDTATYDPRTDSTVRVEATKLRSKLSKYYETEGVTDPLVISIPKGSYAPAFELRAGAGPAGRKRMDMAAVAVGLAALTSGAIWLAFRPTPAPPPPPRMMPLTSFQGNEFRPTLSPDARQVAFSWNGEEPDNYDIYVMTIGGGPPLRLTKTADWEGAPAWSGDGRQIAFLRAGSVFLISPTGGPERKLGQAKNTSMGWAPDGKHLAVTDLPSERATPPGISLISVSTGAKRRLTSPPEKSKGDSHPAISPDGKSLAFVRQHSWAAAGLCLSPVAGGEPRCRPPESEIAGIAWTVDGQELVFSSTRGGAYQLWRLPAGRGFNGQPQLVTGAGENASYPVIAANRLAYQRLSYDVNIWRMEVGGAGRSPTLMVVSTRWDTNPQYSPDGERIAFVSDRTGEFEIYMCDREASTFVQLTSLRGPSIGSPRWSPDGAEIAFHSAARGNSDLYVVGVDGISLRRLTTEDATEAAPSWSSDGRSLYFQSDRSGVDQIWKMPAGGGAAVQVTRDGGVEAMESLDGKWLYFVKSRESAGLWRVALGSPARRPSWPPPLELRGLWRASLSGEKETLILESVRPGYWAVARNGILWVQFTPGRTGGEVRFLDTETNKTTEVARIEKTIIREIPGLSATRDGRRILYSQADRFEADLILLDQFR